MGTSSHPCSIDFPGTVPSLPSLRYRARGSFGDTAQLRPQSRKMARLGGLGPEMEMDVVLVLALVLDVVRVLVLVLDEDEGLEMA